jgi:hypothetical protein
MARTKRVTAGEMIVSGGLLNFTRAVRHASRYGLAAEALGHLPDLDEYREFIGISRAQAFREQQAWRRCVGDLGVLDVVSEEALASRGFTEQEREEAIAVWLAKR